MLKTNSFLILILVTFNFNNLYSVSFNSNGRCKTLLYKSLLELEIGVEDRAIKALQDLGDAYFYGWNTERNLKEALKWYEQAANWGSKYAQSKVELIHFTKKGIPKSYLKRLKEDADNGNKEAQHILGDIHTYGMGGIKEDINEALKYYERLEHQKVISK